MLNRSTRRHFHGQLGVALAGGSWVFSAGCQAPAEESSSGDGGTATRPACDFQASFMTWDFPPPPTNEKHELPFGNMARIQLEAITDVIDDSSGESERFILIQPCRTERVYKEERLFQIPSGEYRVIYSLDQFRSVGTRITYQGGRSKGAPVKDKFRSLAIDVVTFPNTQVLQTPAEVNDTTGANHPTVGRTAGEDPDLPLRYGVEYPIKTMNIMPTDNSYQIDTGPLLVPDFDLEASPVIDRLEMAHVAFNHKHPELAEFILRQPTPVTDEEGKELCKILHYSKVRVDSARNTLLAGMG
ncbi:MAG: hypothetical protein OXH11_06775 [Candidatus Aminicenantes bacterium]|nr:hypothetical protein [Candidatus Aminicenantes bacterium]